MTAKNTIYFYDTCVLLDRPDLITGAKEPFAISVITLKELENIKTSAHKDFEIKAQARVVLRCLRKNKDKYQEYQYKSEYNDIIESHEELSIDSNDSKIIATAIALSRANKLSSQIIFGTRDLACECLAAAAGLEVEYIEDEPEDYSGYIELTLETTDDITNFYTETLSDKKFIDSLEVNQYVLLKDSFGSVIETLKKIDDGHVVELNSRKNREANSIFFGNVKAQDSYQRIAMDALAESQVCMLRGPAGSGKSYLALASLMSKLDKNEISKIIIFCNPIAAEGAGKIGFLPGSKDEKLSDAQIGNFLIGKFGNRAALERFLEDGIIELMPMADIRGYDTSGQRAGIYITEAQNMNVEMMRLALQRIGEDCICILDGDDKAQVDSQSYAGVKNGMRRVSRIFRGESFYSEVTLKEIRRSAIAKKAQEM